MFAPEFNDGAGHFAEDLMESTNCQVYQNYLWHWVRLIGMMTLSIISEEPKLLHPTKSTKLKLNGPVPIAMVWTAE